MTMKYRGIKRNAVMPNNYQFIPTHKEKGHIYGEVVEFIFNEPKVPLNRKKIKEMSSWDFLAEVEL